WFLQRLPLSSTTCCTTRRLPATRCTSRPRTHGTASRASRPRWRSSSTPWSRDRPAVRSMLPPPGSRLRGIDRYLARGERVVFVLRRHAVVLERAIGIWLAAIAAGVVCGLLAPHEPHWNLGVIGGWIVLAGAGFLAWKTGGWWIARYVITDERVMLIDGVVSRRVRAVPLSKITHTDY